MITVERVSYTEIKDQVELLSEYADECSRPELGRIDPQWVMYALLERAGSLKVYAAHADGVMVGFSAVLHHVQLNSAALVGVAQSLFVAKSHRRTSAGRDLMRVIESDARQAGCKAFVYSATAGGQLEAVLGKRYPRAGSSYCKPLG